MNHKEPILLNTTKQGPTKSYAYLRDVQHLLKWLHKALIIFIIDLVPLLTPVLSPNHSCSVNRACCAEIVARVIILEPYHLVKKSFEVRISEDKLACLSRPPYY